MFSSQKLISIFLIALASMLTACGFHLRGSVNLPEGVEPILIESSNKTLSINLRNALSTVGIDVTDQQSQANYRLVIVDYQKERRTASLGEGARAAEYQLIEEVVFELQDKSQQRVIGPNKLTERKIMPNDPSRVVSSSEEEKLLRGEMLQNLAAKLARQLQAYNYTNTPES